MARVAYMDNPRGARMATRRRTRRTTRRPTKKQLAARRRFAAMARARAKAARSHAPNKGGTMARRKRRRTVHRSRHSANPRRRHRRRTATARRRQVRRRYRRNPPRGIFGRVLVLGKRTVTVLAGMGVGRGVTNMLPLAASDNPNAVYVSAGVGVGLALAAEVLLSKPLGRELAEDLALGLLLNPLKDVITSTFPATTSFLGAGVMSFPAPGVRRLAAYPPAGGAALPGSTTFDTGSAGMGSYPQEVGGYY